MSRIDIESRLKALNIKLTAQRIEVAELMLRRPQHLSAEQIIERLQANGSRVSKATVYNCLKVFSETGLVKEINVDATRKYYDTTTGPHHHFYNIETGELTDIPADKIGIASLPPLPKGTEQAGVEVLIKVRNK